ncbi:acyl-CoA dehydrogenase family protein [Amycolatopsis jejuensis]|uniref:acyl-CoA dehydrogenase family protein n=1 Tax=Amycolatopsis jejuensis TaxID=330084 RepID=UPI000524865E|nr:acyl-CoA dehydrogenase family protein [Amycolatopsis jejuensis]
MTIEAVVRDALDTLFRDHWPAGRREFLSAQFDAGLAWVHLPEGSGGLGLPRAQQSGIFARIDAEGAPNGRARNPLAYAMGAPTIAAWGTAAQIERYLRPIFLGDEHWCQLFSEPGAGSDLAAVATRAVRDGDEWIVNGQKVWSSMAHVSEIGMLVARTDPDVPKHRGLTYFALDLSLPGVEVRPLRQMTGDAEFTEVYLTDVRIPDSCRIGDVGAGWKVCVSTLMNERVMFGSGGSGPVDLALELARDSAELRRDPELRARLIRLWIRARVLRLTNARATTDTAGPQGSIGKIGYAEINKAGYELCMDLLGGESLLYDDYTTRVPEGWGQGIDGGDVRRRFLRSRANSIEGGTTEIMRTILAERILGLPPEPRADKDRPWSEVPRG